MIDTLGLALLCYKEEFGYFPPGGLDSNDDGDTDDPGEKAGAGEPGGAPERRQLRVLCETIEVKNDRGIVERTVGPYYNPRMLEIRNGAVVDLFGNPLRYLADGRRKEIDPTTGKPLKGRVDKRTFVLWSVGPDGVQDAGNNNLDDDGDGAVDEPDEMHDDICSWH